MGGEKQPSLTSGNDIFHMSKNEFNFFVKIIYSKNNR